MRRESGICASRDALSLGQTGIMGSASAHSAPEKQMAALHAPISVSESSTKAGKVRTAHQRLHLKSIMATPAIHWAQNYLIEQGSHRDRYL